MGQLDFVGVMSASNGSWYLYASVCADNDVSTEPYYNLGTAGPCSIWLSGTMDWYDFCYATSGSGSGSIYPASTHPYDVDVTWARYDTASTWRTGSTFVMSGLATGYYPPSWGPVRITAHSVFPPGSYYWCNDQSVTGTVVFGGTGIENAAPVASLQSPADGAAFAEGAPVTFSLSANDPEWHDWVGRVEVRSGSTVVGTYATPATASGQTASTSPPATLPPGTYSWSATATDVDGATSPPTSSRTFTVQGPPANQPPTPNLVSPSNGATFAAGAPVTFSMSASDPEGHDWVGRIEGCGGPSAIGTNFTSKTSSGQTASTVSPIVLPPGNYSWTATASDVDGATSGPAACRTFTVQGPPANQPPTPNPVSPSNGATFAAGAPVTFSMSASDPQGDQWTGRVEVRSGTTVVGTYATPVTASGQTASTSPPATLPPGTYTWSATATDSQGATSAPTSSRSFTVQAPAANAAPGTPTLVAPSDGTYSFGEPATFTVRADDPNLDPYTAHIEIDCGGTTYDIDTLYTASGADASGSPGTFLPPGSCTWWATAQDVHGATGPQSSTGSFTVSSSFLNAV